MMLVTYGVLPHCHLLVASHELLPWLPIQCSEVSRLSTNMVAYVSPSHRLTVSPSHRLTVETKMCVTVLIIIKLDVLR